MNNKIPKYIFLSLLILLFLNGCGSNSDGNINTDEDIFQYKGSVIGDNSAAINIIGKLQHNEAFQEVSLETREKPYGMTLKYKNIDTAKIEKETTIYNATFLFTLINNVEWITFNFGEHKYKITRSKLQDLYGKVLDEFANEEEVKTFVQEQLEDESKVNQILSK